MDVTKALEWAVGQGIGAVLALGMFLYYRRDVHNALNSWKDQTVVLTKLVQDVSMALQANTDAIRSMERSLPHACPMSEHVASGAIDEAVRRLHERVR